MTIRAILFLVVIAGLNMSALFPINKIAAEAGIGYLPYVCSYAVGAGLLVALVAGLRGQLRHLRIRQIPFHFLSGILGFALPFTLLALIAAKLPSGLAALLLVLTPVFTYFVALVFRVETFKILNIVGLALALAGICLIIIPTGALPGTEMAGWFLLALLVPASFAVLNIVVEVLSPTEAPPLTLAVGLLFAGAIELLLVILATGHRLPFVDLVGLGPAALFAVIGAAIVNAIMWPLFYLIVNRAGGFQFSVMNIVALVAAITWGVVFFGEQHSYYVWMAIGLMIAGFVMTTMSHRDR